MSGGGFLEHCSSTETRPRPRIALPDRGPFSFGAPYNTLGIRVTNESDGPILPTAYSYWQAINSHAGQDHLLVFLGTDRQRGGQGPSLWRVDKATDQVTPLGPLFPDTHPLSWATGEGWYWSATDPHILYASDLEHLWRLDVRTKAMETVVDISGPPFKAFGCVLWQFHSSHDGLTHSATVKLVADNYRPVGTIVYRERLSQPWSWYPAVGALDESQIDKSGEWLLIKENLDGQDGEDNRIIHVPSGRERVLLDRQGAAGHSDSGFGYMVAADNWNDKPNAIRVWPFDDNQAPQGRLVYHSPVWNVEVNHVSHCNARPGSPDGQWVLGSSATDAIGPRANEIVAFPLDGSLRVLVIAPNLTAPGAGYDDLPKASLDLGGQYAIWTANGHGRRDAFMVRVPWHLL